MVGKGRDSRSLDDAQVIASDAFFASHAPGFVPPLTLTLSPLGGEGTAAMRAAAGISPRPDGVHVAKRGAEDRPALLSPVFGEGEQPHILRCIKRPSLNVQLPTLNV